MSEGIKYVLVLRSKYSILNQVQYDTLSKDWTGNEDRTENVR